MDSPSGDDTQALFFNPRKGLGIREDDEADRELRRLSGRNWINEYRLTKLERELATLYHRLYLLCFITLILTTFLSLSAAHWLWHLRP